VVVRERTVTCFAKQCSHVISPDFSYPVTCLSQPNSMNDKLQLTLIEVEGRIHIIIADDGSVSGAKSSISLVSSCTGTNGSTIRGT
jgi:hypothetical protein